MRSSTAKGPDYPQKATDPQNVISSPIKRGGFDCAWVWPVGNIRTLHLALALLMAAAVLTFFEATMLKPQNRPQYITIRIIRSPQRAQDNHALHSRVQGLGCRVKTDNLV